MPQLNCSKGKLHWKRSQRALPSLHPLNASSRDLDAAGGAGGPPSPCHTAGPWSLHSTLHRRQKPFQLASSCCSTVSVVQNYTIISYCFSSFPSSTLNEKKYSIHPTRSSNSWMNSWREERKKHLELIYYVNILLLYLELCRILD